jgi:hypothetical protein
MKLSEMIKSLESLKDKFGDYELLFCNQNGEVHYSFTVEDWSDPDCPQLLLEGYTSNADKPSD